MAFDGYLKFDDLQSLRGAATDGGLLMKPRVLLFEEIRPSFAAALMTDPAPDTQFLLDLSALNKVERLEDGMVPLVLYLRNAAALLRDLPQAVVFQRYQSVVQNRAAGAATVEALTQLPAAVITRQAVIHQDDTVDRTFLENCLRAARSVAKLIVPRFDGGQQKFLNGVPWLFNGTGWLLTPTLLITNHHVINGRRDDEGDAPPADFERQAKNTRAMFDFDTESSEPPPVGVAAVAAADAGLDYCIVRLAAPVSNPPLALPRQLIEITATTYLPLNVIQHPHGKAKRFAIRNNLAVDADNDLVRYYTDTDFGSSGSPVMDDQWRVVALHRGAILRPAKFQGKDTAFVNVGSQVFRILEHLKASKPTVHQEIVGP